MNQGTIEEAAVWMASLAKVHPELAIEFDRVLVHSIEAAAQGDASVMAAVNLSGYRASTDREAGQYCTDLLNAYQALHGGNA